MKKAAESPQTLGSTPIQSRNLLHLHISIPDQFITWIKKHAMFSIRQTASSFFILHPNLIRPINLAPILLLLLLLLRLFAYYTHAAVPALARSTPLDALANDSDAIHSSLKKCLPDGEGTPLGVSRALAPCHTHGAWHDSGMFMFFSVHRIHMLFMHHDLVERAALLAFLVE